MTGPRATIFVCVSCRRAAADGGEAFDLPGSRLVAALERELVERGVHDIAVEPVECLAVCKRPCTIAVTGPGRWTYLIGDLDEASHAAEIADGVVAYAATENGIVAWRERPPTFRRGVVARVPPPGFKQPPPEGT